MRIEEAEGAECVVVRDGAVDPREDRIWDVRLGWKRMGPMEVSLRGDVGSEPFACAWECIWDCSTPV